MIKLFAALAAPESYLAQPDLQEGTVASTCKIMGKSQLTHYFPCWYQLLGDEGTGS
jgi:hypothetical protein